MPEPVPPERLERIKFSLLCAPDRSGVPRSVRWEDVADMADEIDRLRADLEAERRRNRNLSEGG